MENQLTLKIENLTDEQVLREFVKRFDCDGAILVYKSDDMEAGFGRWSNQSGRKWVNGILKTLKQAT
ncbi:MAG: hypothetical protein EOO20_15360 [Chryseobacterium sp.]|uniref:hypothetical protein n=1 Tax=Pedobacter aquatilis TaxID=351343 RepID=UPI001216BBDF|nr:hypothetical protein [Pedobacter aquatilis]RZJ87734.1 MAG: hypothetical protein EOO20_15360 [Chryseobacterium sp.]